MSFYGQETGILLRNHEIDSTIITKSCNLELEGTWIAVLIKLHVTVGLMDIWIMHHGKWMSHATEWLYFI